jgi:hypothetical protein
MVLLLKLVLRIAPVVLLDGTVLSRHYHRSLVTQELILWVVTLIANPAMLVLIVPNRIYLLKIVCRGRSPQDWPLIVHIVRRDFSAHTRTKMQYFLA